VNYEFLRAAIQSLFTAGRRGVVDGLQNQEVGLQEYVVAPVLHRKPRANG
jgi:hypothetical protein